MKYPGNEAVLEEGTYENIKRETINNSLQVAGFRLPVAGQDFTHA